MYIHTIILRFMIGIVLYVHVCTLYNDKQCVMSVQYSSIIARVYSPYSTVQLYPGCIVGTVQFNDTHGV